MPISPNKSTVPANSRMPSPSLTKGNRLLEHLSLALCGVLALAFAIVVAPLQVPDEHGHFLRAYVISRGEFAGRAIPALPASVVSFVKRYPEASERFRKLTPREIVRDLPADAATYAAGNTVLANEDGHHAHLVSGVVASSTYCPLVYLPASLGIWTARALHASPLVMMYAARMFNVIAFVAALAVSFRLAPRCRALMTAVALMPMTLQQAGGISADLVTIALSFVGLSLVLYAREHLVSRRFLFIVAVVFVMWSLCKFSIWALPLLLLIPSSAFQNRRAWLAYIAAVSICMAGALLIWGRIAAGNMEALRALRLTVGVDISANVRLVIAHPLAFARHLLEIFHSNYKYELVGFIGAFGWWQFSLPLWTRAVYLLLLLLAAATGFSTKPFLWWERGVLLLVCLAGAVFVHATLAVSDIALSADHLGRIYGDFSSAVQGRYFLPFCLAGLLILRQSRANLPKVTLLAIVTGVGTIHALAALALIRSAFYL